MSESVEFWLMHHLLAFLLRLLIVAVVLAKQTHLSPAGINNLTPVGWTQLAEPLHPACGDRGLQLHSGVRVLSQEA